MPEIRSENLVSDRNSNSSRYYKLDYEKTPNFAELTD